MNKKSENKKEDTIRYNNSSGEKEFISNYV